FRGRHRSLERLEQIDDLRFGRFGSRGDFLARDLLLHGSHDPIGPFVAEAGGLELVALELLDELVGEVELDRLELERAARIDIIEGADLIGVVTLVKDEPLLVGPHEDEVVFPTLRKAAYGDTIGSLERLRKKPISAIAALVRSEEVRLLDVEEVDRVSR